MNLDDYSAFQKYDPQNMLGQIDDLPEQLKTAWKQGQEQPLPGFQGIRQILIAGMGGSAIGADLLTAYAAPHCEIPVVVHRDYGLPAWAKGEDTLFIASSHSGNTEETLSAFEQARERGCQMVAISTGGKLEQLAGETNIPVWKFEHHGQPRSAVGFSFGYLLALFSRLQLIPDPKQELLGALTAMRQQQEKMGVKIPAVLNPGKRIAGQLVGRIVTVIGSDYLAPVARRWKGQINELAKAWATFDLLPEADHNTLAGITNPESGLQNLLVLFLRGASDHPRNGLRSDVTRKRFMLEGLTTDYVDASGDTPLAQMWTALHFGDYVTYYLAMAYGINPTPVDAIQSLKAEMG
jgi:glucose/mannose-6-phosphate isomerase